jgi:hypothetical protein
MGNYLCRTFPNLFATRRLRVHEQYTNRCINCKTLYLSQFRDHICPGCRISLTGGERTRLLERHHRFSPKPIQRPTWKVSKRSNHLSRVFPELESKSAHPNNRLSE